MTFNLYIVNNERVCGRDKDKNEYFTISASPFLSTKLENDDFIFQLIQDIQFNAILPKTASLEFYIVAIENSITNKKLKILEFFNTNKKYQGIKKILTFKNSICNSLSHDNQSLKMSSEVQFDFIKSILHRFLPDELILKIATLIQNVDIEFMVHPYKGELYISNPSFLIDKHLLKELILSKY